MTRMPVLPCNAASVAFVGGLAFAASKVDEEFDDFIKGTILKVRMQAGNV